MENIDWIKRQEERISLLTAELERAKARVRQVKNGLNAHKRELDSEKLLRAIFGSVTSEDKEKEDK